MTANQARDKLRRAQNYLTDAHKRHDDSVLDAWDELSAARFRVRDTHDNQMAGRKAARRYGQKCLMTLTAGEHPISRTIDDLDVNEAVKLAVKAAKNAFWAHPELREAENAN